MRMLKGKKMFSFDVIEDVEMNDSNGGWIKVKVSENVDDSYDSMVSRVVVLSFDFGESLSSIDIEGSDEEIENVFSEECCEMLWKMEFQR